MPYEIRVRRRVEFNETDAAGVVHFTNFFRYCEATEAEFLRRLGLSLHRADVDYALPRVDARCRYLSPACFEDELEIHLLVARKCEKTIEYRFQIHVDPDGERRLAAEATIIVICVAVDPLTRRPRARALPAEIAASIEEAPAELPPRES